MAVSFFIHIAAAFTALVPFGALAFMATFFPGGRRGCAWSVGVLFSLVGVGACFLVPVMVREGTAAGAVVGAVIGAMAGRLSTPRDRR